MSAVAVKFFFIYRRVKVKTTLPVTCIYLYRYLFERFFSRNASSVKKSESFWGFSFLYERIAVKVDDDEMLLLDP